MKTSIIFYLDSLSRSKKPEILPSSSFLSCYIQAWTLFFFTASGFPSPALPHFSVTKSSYCCWQACPASCFLSIHFFARNISPLVPCYWQISNTLPTQVLHHRLLPIVSLPSSVSPSKLMFPAARILPSLECFQSSEFEPIQKMKNMRRNRPIKWIVRWLLRCGFLDYHDHPSGGTLTWLDGRTFLDGW